MLVYEYVEAFAPTWDNINQPVGKGLKKIKSKRLVETCP